VIVDLLKAMFCAVKATVVAEPVGEAVAEGDVVAVGTTEAEGLALAEGVAVTDAEAVGDTTIGTLAEAAGEAIALFGITVRITDATTGGVKAV
jgi:hypothetical protein